LMFGHRLSPEPLARSRRSRSELDAGPISRIGDCCHPPETCGNSTAKTSSAARLSHLSALAGMPRSSFLIEIPCAVPIAGRRICLQLANALDRRHRRPVAGNRLERRAESLTRFVPSASTIGGKPLGISFPHHRLRRREFVLAAHELAHRLG